tara:strand:+ start:585 stop:710 length:126 start_codon:yes stop_codon:yes gene_type:complete
VVGDAASAFSDSLGGKERVNYFIEVAFGNTHPSVFNGNKNI